MTHRTTFALDATTATRLKTLAARWQVSQAEVVRRSVERAEQNETLALTAEDRISAARQLREQLLRRKVNVKAWIQAARDSRR